MKFYKYLSLIFVYGLSFTGFVSAMEKQNQEESKKISSMSDEELEKHIVNAFEKEGVKVDQDKLKKLSINLEKLAKEYSQKEKNKSSVSFNDFENLKYVVIEENDGKITWSYKLSVNTDTKKVMYSCVGSSWEYLSQKSGVGVEKGVLHKCGLSQLMKLNTYKKKLLELYREHYSDNQEYKE